MLAGVACRVAAGQSPHLATTANSRARNGQPAFCVSENARSHSADVKCIGVPSLQYPDRMDNALPLQFLYRIRG